MPEKNEKNSIESAELVQ